MPFVQHACTHAHMYVFIYVRTYVRTYVLLFYKGQINTAIGLAFNLIKQYKFSHTNLCEDGTVG